MNRRDGLKTMTALTTLSAFSGGVVTVLTMPPADAQAVYRTYLNRRYEYAVDYPADMLTPQGEAPNGDEQAFISRDATVTLKVWGEINALEKSLTQRYAELSAASEKRRVTYKHLSERDRWFVVSGTDGETTYYQKTMGNREMRFLTLLLTYPLTSAALWNAHTSRIARSFRRDV